MCQTTHYLNSALLAELLQINSFDRWNVHLDFFITIVVYFHLIATCIQHFATTILTFSTYVGV